MRPLALVLRLVFGPLADRTGRYWSLTLVGYALTAVCVPAAGAHAVRRRRRTRGRLRARPGRTHRQGGAQPVEVDAARPRRRRRSASAGGSRCTRRWTRSARSPGRCWSPAVVALTGALWPAMAVLAVPGAVVDRRCCSCCGARVRRPVRPRRRPAAVGHPRPPARRLRPTGRAAGLPRRVLAVRGLRRRRHRRAGHVRGHLLPPGRARPRTAAAVVPVVYAAAMAAEAVAALATGWLYDRSAPGCCWCCRCWSPPFRRWRSPMRLLVLVPASSSGEPRSGCRTPPSRPWWPTSCPPRRRATAYGVVRGRPGRRRRRRRRAGRCALRAVGARPGRRGRRHPAGRPHAPGRHPAPAGTHRGGHPSAVTTAHRGPLPSAQGPTFSDR